MSSSLASSPAVAPSNAVTSIPCHGAPTARPTAGVIGALRDSGYTLAFG